MKVWLLSPWTGNGASARTAFKPLLVQAYSRITCTDLCGTPGPNLPCRPNLVLLEAECSQATLTSIRGDSRFLLLTDGPELPLMPSELVSLRAFLTRSGTPANQLDSATAGDSRRRHQHLLRQLATWLQSRPRA